MATTLSMNLSPYRNVLYGRFVPVPHDALDWVEYHYHTEIDRKPLPDNALCHGEYTLLLHCLSYMLNHYQILRLFTTCTNTEALSSTVLN